MHALQRRYLGKRIECDAILHEQRIPLAESWLVVHMQRYRYQAVAGKAAHK